MKIENDEGRLLNVIAEIGVLEWRKYQQRFPEVMVGNKMQRQDRSAFLPFIAFRFKNVREVDVEKLKRVVENYKGALLWSMVGRQREGLPGTNWMIAPSRLWEVSECALKSNMTAAAYLSIHEPSLGPAAYEDLVALTEYVCSEFEIS